MEPPQILLIEKYSQNLLISATTIEQVFGLFKFTQTVGLEAIEWIEEARRHCAMLGDAHGWHWAIPKVVDYPLVSNLPLLEGQGLIMAGLDVTLDSDIPPSCPPSPDLS